MNELRRRYLELSALISDPAHIPFWSLSVLQNWPLHRALVPSEWTLAVVRLGEDERRCFLDGMLSNAMPADLRAFVHRVTQLCDLPHSTLEAPLAAADEQGLTPKKIHEIRRLLPILGRDAEAFRRAVDIGGGKGHLARVCIREFGWRFTTIDRDAALQNKGKWWLERTRQFPRENLKFIEASVEDGAQSFDNEFAASDTFSVGLHTCGPLALTHMRKSRDAGAIVNVGCCFDKIDAGSSDLNVSSVAQNNPLPWTQHALYLATRGRYRLSALEFGLLERVYRQRFTLQLWLKEFQPEKIFVTVGDAPAALYRESFAVYADNRLKHLGILHESIDAELGLYAVREDVRNVVDEMIALHHLRNLWARPLEVALLLDRALWLEEQGWEVDAVQVFDRELSPRNIALISRARADR